VYDGGLIYCDQIILDGVVTGFYDKHKALLLKDFPNSQALTIQLYSSVNMFGYALRKWHIGASVCR
jgi:hypothetical protein